MKNLRRLIPKWIWLYFSGGRGARLITGDERMPKVIKPPPDFRIIARDSIPSPPPVDEAQNHARKPA